MEEGLVVVVEAQMVVEGVRLLELAMGSEVEVGGGGRESLVRKATIQQ